MQARLGEGDRCFRALLVTVWLLTSVLSSIDFPRGGHHLVRLCCSQAFAPAELQAASAAF